MRNSRKKRTFFANFGPGKTFPEALWVTVPDRASQHPSSHVWFAKLDVYVSPKDRIEEKKCSIVRNCEKLVLLVSEKRGKEIIFAVEETDLKVQLRNLIGKTFQRLLHDLRR